MKRPTLRRRGPVSLADLDREFKKAQGELRAAEEQLPSFEQAVEDADVLDVDVRLGSVEEAVAVEAQAAAREARQEAARVRALRT